MTNTSFDEEVTNKNSKRNSLGKNSYRNELSYFVNNSQDMKKLHEGSSLNQHYLNFKKNKEVPPT